MNGGAVLTLVIVLGYVAFELVGLHQSRHLMEPLNIVEKFTAADQAMARCGDASPELRARFEHNLASVTRRAVGSLTESDGGLSAADATTQVAEATAAQRSAVDQIVDSAGCADKQVWSWLKLYEQRAQMNLH